MAEQLTLNQRVDSSSLSGLTTFRVRIDPGRVPPGSRQAAARFVREVDPFVDPSLTPAGRVNNPIQVVEDLPRWQADLCQLEADAAGYHAAGPVLLRNEIAGRRAP